MEPAEMRYPIGRLVGAERMVSAVELEVHITGMTALVMENPRMADPDEEFVQRKGELTSKTRKTSDDRKEIDRLDFLGSLYLNSTGPYVPSNNLRKCWVDAGRATRDGKAVERSAMITSVSMPVQYDGPRSPEDLLQLESHQLRMAVNRSTNAKTKKLIMCVRPMFQRWSIVAEVQLMTDYMDLNDFERVVTTAGLTEGLGGARAIGYGRHKAVVKPL